MLTNRTRASLVQLLTAINQDAVRLLLLKHLDHDVWPITPSLLLKEIEAAGAEGITGLLVELISDRTAIRSDAPTKYVFDGRRSDLVGNLRTDGYEVIEDALTRLNPAAEPAAQISDYLEAALQRSGFDLDGRIARLLRDSHQSLSGSPPDFNDATTKARIALETVVRRSAASIATLRDGSEPEDRWGPSLSFLTTQGVITTPEEEALAKIYTLISPGAHIPKGLTDQQWALLSRTFAISGAYFLLQQHLAA